MVSISAREIMDPRNSERLICDVILDQLILPGVGNIIKNEALFDAGINPLTKVSHTKIKKDLARPQHGTIMVFVPVQFPDRKWS